MLYEQDKTDAKKRKDSVVSLPSIERPGRNMQLASSKTPQPAMRIAEQRRSSLPQFHDLQFVTNSNFYQGDPPMNMTKRVFDSSQRLNGGRK